MASIAAYLTFSGNCRNAMSFYRDCLGGDLLMQTLGTSPLCSGMPDVMKDFILHATLKNGGLVLMASDMAGPGGIVSGNHISLALECDSEEHLRHCYLKLSEGGAMTHPAAAAADGALFGNLTDKFGNHWLLHFQSNRQ